MRQVCGIRALLTVLSAVVPAVGMTVLWWMLPAHADDVWYDQGVRDFMAQGHDRWQAILCEMRVHFMTDNLRLANVTYLLGSGWLPRQVTACLLGACMALGLWGLARLAGCGLRSAGRVAVLASAYVYIMPWMAYPFSHDFALNYVPSVALCAWTAWLFCRPGPVRRGGVAALMALALLTGFWHEGAAVPLIVAFPVYMYVSGRCERWRWLVWLALMPGVLFYVCSPGFWYRLAQMGTGGQGFSFKWAYMLTVALVALTVWLWVVTRGRRAVRPEWLCVLGLCAAAGAGGFVLAMGVSGCERAVLCGMMLCLSGWARVADMVWRRIGGKALQSAPVWLAGVAVSVLAWHFAVVVTESRSMLVRYERALCLYVESGASSVCCDLDYGRELPCLWRECRPGRQFLRAGYVQQRLSIWWRGEDRQQIFYDDDETGKAG